MLDILSDLIFAVFDLYTCGSLISGRTCINFCFSYAVELIIPPFYEFLKIVIGKENFSKDCFYYFIYLTVISFVQ